MLPLSHVGLRQSINCFPLVADIVKPGDIGLDCGLDCGLLPNLLGNESFLYGKSGDVHIDSSGVDEHLSR